MSRYIDADALQERLRVEFEREGTKADEMAMLGCGEASVKYNHGQFCYLNALELVKDAPAADVVEVRHGEWVEQDDGWDGVLYTCSVCHCDWTTIDGTPFENNMRYCPECGAKMDGERKEK